MAYLQVKNINWFYRNILTCRNVCITFMHLSFSHPNHYLQIFASFFILNWYGNIRFDIESFLQLSTLISSGRSALDPHTIIFVWDTEFPVVLNPCISLIRSAFEYRADGLFSGSTACILFNMIIDMQSCASCWVTSKGCNSLPLYSDI